MRSSYGSEPNFHAVALSTTVSEFGPLIAFLRPSQLPTWCSCSKGLNRFEEEGTVKFGDFDVEALTSFLTLNHDQQDRVWGVLRGGEEWRRCR